MIRFPTRIIVLISVFLFVATTVAGCGNDSVEARLARASEQIQEQQYATAIINLKDVLSDEPGNLQALVLLGSTYYEIESFPEAEQRLKQVIDGGAADSATLLKYADSLLQLDKHEETLNIIRQAPFEDIHADRASAIEASALVGLGKFNEAENIAQAASSAAPDSADLSIALSKIYLAQGKRFAGIQAARKAVELDPDNHRAHDQLGSLLLNEKMYSSAIDSFESALEKTPIEGMSAASLRTQLNLLRSYLATNDLENANARIAKLNEMAPEHPAITYFSALMHYNAREYDLALQKALATLTTLPDHQPSELLAGIVSYRINNLEQANMYLGKVLSSTPTNSAARKLYAATQLKLDNPAAASATLRAGLAHNPDDLSLQEIIAQLQEVTDRSPIAHLIDPEQTDDGAKMPTFANLIDSLDNQELVEIQSEITTIRSLADSGNIDQAFTRVLALIEKHPKEARLYEFAGIVAQLANRPADAETFYRTAMEMEPLAIGSAINLVNLHKLTNTTNEAEKTLQSLLEQTPGSLAALTGLAKIASNQNQPAAVIDYFERAIGANPRAPDPRISLVKYYRENDKQDAARAEIVAAVTAIPDNSDLIILQAQQMIVDGDEQAAVEKLRSLLDTKPESPDALIALSIALSGIDQPEQAVIPLRQAHRLIPTSYKLTQRLAALELQIGNDQEALSLVENYGNLTDDQVGSHLLTATIKMSKGDYAGATEAYSQAHALRPSEQTLLLQVASMHRNGNTEQAIALLVDWVDDHVDHKKSRFELATLQLFSGNFHDAAHHYEVLLDQGGEIADVFNNLAWAYQQTGDPRAVPTAETGHNRFPEDPYLADTLGWALVTENKELDRGVELLQHAYGKTDHPSIGFHLAQAFVQQGNNTAALALLRTLLNDGGDFPERAAAAKLMTQLPQ